MADAIVTGAKLIAKNIIAYREGFIRHTNKTMKRVENLLDKQVTKNISLTDHSLSDLRKMGHPYAVRHGSQGFRIHEPYWLVHKQSGKLLAAKKSGIREASVSLRGELAAMAFVFVDANEVPHALNVVYGTSKMIPRRFLQESRAQVIEEAQKIIRDNLKDLKFNFAS